MSTIYSLEDLKNISPDKLKAAYALNMCTVSVSQIIDYNDVYILEQEYDAILNNLNLEVIPKDEALLRTLTEILNTITFFRIQDIKKKQLEKEYQQRVKNAIWSAIPNLSVVVTGNPVAAVIALATQVGTGYMNYRREKKSALTDKEKKDVELQITAIEQLNALRRELFTTAWRLADKYGFPDDLRLTENQIKQYNNILMDQDEYRKYARLESIQTKFFAYPPFWYNFAHTALYIATSTDDKSVKTEYLQKAQSHFEQYVTLDNNNCILREDQLGASAYLEYTELLFTNPFPDYDRIASVIDVAVRKSGNANDVIEMCALAYLRAGKSDSAARLFKILVNEEYNTVSNAKILSRLYVSEYLSSRDNNAKNSAYSNYRILARRTDPVYLFPFPENNTASEKLLNDSYISKQKALLKKQYRLSINEYSKKMAVEFNSVLPAPTLRQEEKSYFGYSAKAEEIRKHDAEKIFENNADDYRRELLNCDFCHGFIDVLNITVAGLENLSCFKDLYNHDALIQLIEKNINDSKFKLVYLQGKVEKNDFNFDHYISLVKNCSYKKYTENFFDKLKEEIMTVIDTASDLKVIENYSSELEDFCTAQNLPNPEEYIHTYKPQNVSTVSLQQNFFSYELLGKSNKPNVNYPQLCAVMLNVIKDKISYIIKDETKVKIFLYGDKKLETYIENDSLTTSESKYQLKQKAVAVIDDSTKENLDLILCVDGIRPVLKDKVQDCAEYNDISYKNSNNKPELIIPYSDAYTNKNVDLIELKSIIDELAKIKIQ